MNRKFTSAAVCATAAAGLAAAGLAAAPAALAGAAPVTLAVPCSASALS